MNKGIYLSLNEELYLQFVAARESAGFVGDRIDSTAIKWIITRFIQEHLTKQQEELQEIENDAETTYA